jgi:hypothetical protein
MFKKGMVYLNCIAISSPLPKDTKFLSESAIIYRRLQTVQFQWN